MEGLSSFISPSSLDCQMTKNSTALFKFCDYICSDRSRLDEIDYWSNVNRFLCLIECSHTFLKSVSGIHFSFDIDPLLKSCSKMLDFCMDFLDLLCKSELSLSRQVCIYLITSFLRGLYETEGFLYQHILTIAQEVVDFEYSNIPENSLSSISRVDNSRTNSPNFIDKRTDSNWEFGFSSAISDSIDFRDFILQLSSPLFGNPRNYDSLSTCSIKATVSSHNLHHFLERSLKMFLSNVSKFLSTSSLENPNLFANTDLTQSFDILFHEVSSLLNIVSLPKLFDTCQHSINLLSNACLSMLNTVLTNEIFDSTIQDTQKSHYLKFTYSKVIKISLEVCDRFYTMLHLSNQPNFVEGNFRLFQTCLLLRKFDFIRNPNIAEEITNRSTKIELLPQTIEIINWIISSIRNIFSDLDQCISQPHDSIPFQEPNIFISSTPNSRFVYLMDQVPVLPILFYFLVNSYSISFSAFICSSIFEYNLSIQKDHLVTDSNNQSIPFSSALEESLIFLFTQNIPISNNFFCSLTNLSLRMKSVDTLVNELFSSTNLGSFRFDNIFRHSNKILNYYIKLLSNSYLCFKTIPSPPPNIPFSCEVLFKEKSKCFYSFDQLNLLLGSESYTRITHSDLFPCFLQLSRDILIFLRDIFISSHDISRYFLQQNISTTEVSAFIFLILEITDSYTLNKFLISQEYLLFSKDMLSTIHYFLFSELFDNSLQLYFLENIGLSFSMWPLCLSEPLLFILSRILFFHAKFPITSHDHFLLRISNAFFDTLERKIASTSQHPDEYEDVNYLHLKLLLFSFSFIPLVHKKSILYRIVFLIHGFVLQKASNISSHIAVCRLITLFEYFLFFFTGPNKSLFKCISSCFSDNSSVFNPDNISTSTLEQSFRLFFTDQNINLIQLLTNPLPRFYYIFDRCPNHSKIDKDCLLALNEMHLHLPITYSEFYCDLLILTFSVDCFSQSVSSPNSSLFSFYINYRFESLNNILSFIPCLRLVPIDVALGSVPLESYSSLFLNIRAKQLTDRHDLSEAIIDFYLTEELDIEKKYASSISLSKRLYRPIDVIYLSESFFSNVIDSNTLSEFHLLLLTTSFVLMLYENLLTLQNLSFSASSEKKPFPDFHNSQKDGSKIDSNTDQIALVPEFEHSSIDMRHNTKTFFNNPDTFDLEHLEFGASLKQFLLQDLSVRFIPKIFPIIQIIAESCANYLIRHSPSYPQIPKTLLDLCTVLSSTKDLTLFPYSCNIPLFDSCLSDSDNIVFNSFQNVSLNCLDEISLPGESFLKKKHSLNDILECYLYSLTLNQTNCLLPMYKHCISSTTSLIKFLYKWSGDADILNEYSLNFSSFVHSAPFLSLAPGCSLDQVIPKQLFTSISNASTLNLIKKSYQLIHNPDLRYFCNANNVLSIYFNIILRCVKDSKLNRILCEVVKSEPHFNFFIPFFFPIYPEYRICLNLSIQTFADTLIYQKENHFEESSILISHLNEGAFLDQVRIFTWFNYAMLGYPGEDEKTIEERCDKLLVLANAISTGGTILNPLTCQFMLITILPLGYKLLDYIQRLLTRSKIGKEFDVEQKLKFRNSHSYEFPLSYSHPCLNCFLPIITGLAEVHNVNGELQILRAVCSWLPRCKELVLDYISSRSDFLYDEFLSEFGASCSFLSDLLEQIKLISTVVKILMSRDGFNSVITKTLGDCSIDEHHSEDEEGDSSTFMETDRLLNVQLCTSTLHKDEFKQHWYNCYSCKHLEFKAICSICAKVCHKGHDLSYVTFSFIKCQCGSISSNSCICLSGRRGINFQKSFDDCSNGGLDDREYYPSMFPSIACEKFSNNISKTQPQFDPELIRLVEAIEGEPGLKDELYSALELLDISEHTLDILDALAIINTRCPSVPAQAPNYSITDLLHKLHYFPKSIEYSESFAQFNLRSPEGSFENVKLTFNDDASPNMESLLCSFSVPRNSLCTVNGIEIGSGQFLIVSMDKGRFTTLNRSILFKPESNNKKKITINKIENMVAPFNILSMCSNPFCEEFLAICGLKECSVYILSPNGSFTGKNLSVQVGIEGQNYIVKCFWLPISKTILAVITAQYVKIFDLSLDCIAPLYYFCVRSDHIVDSTFISTSTTLLLVIMTHTGELLYQKIYSESMAEHGTIYISSKIEVILSEDVSNQSTRRAGSSVYFSHCLQLLFFSYAQGINLVASFEHDYSTLKHIMPIIYKNAKTPVTLYQWTESHLQPGLICALSQSNISPVIIFLLSNTINIYDFKLDSTKSKVQGIVLNVNMKNLSVEGRTSLILLYEDGSLRIHFIKTDKILFWQTYNLNNPSPLQNFRGKRKAKSFLNSSPLQSIPVDFFETCILSEDIEFGGNDVLHVYNQSQIKSRLSSEFHYIFNSKASGFNIEIISTNSNNVFVGIQLQLGCNSIVQSPSYVELFNRRITIEFLNDKGRWFDIPFSQDESMRSITKFVVKFGPSKDSNSFNFVDSIKVYSKTKEEFGFTSLLESDQFTTKSQFPSQISQMEEHPEILIEGNKNETEIDRITNLSLTLLCESGSISVEKRNNALRIVTQLLLCSLDKPLKEQCKALLHELHSTPQEYFSHKDEAICCYVVAKLYMTPEADLAPELYQQLLLNLHSIALARPFNIARLQDISYILKCCEDFNIYNPGLEMDASANIPILSTFVDKMLSLFWSFFQRRPFNTSLAPIGSPGLLCIKETVTIITGIIYSFLLNDINILHSAIENFFVFIKCDYECIWESCLSTLCLLLRPRSFERFNQPNISGIPDFTPHTSSSGLLTPGYSQENETEGFVSVVSIPNESLMDAKLLDSGELMQDEFISQRVPISTHPDAEDSCMDPNPLEVLLTDQDILAELGISHAHDIDDDSIMNLALAISLQNPKLPKEHGGDQMGIIQCSNEGYDSSQLPNNLAIDIRSIHQSASSPPDKIAVDEHDHSGDQSSTGTLTPPSKFSGALDIQNSKDETPLIQNNFEELSSDQAGDSSPDEVDPCSTQSPYSGPEDLVKERADILIRNEASQLSRNIAPDKDRLLTLNTSLIFVLVKRLPEILKLGGIKAIHYMQLFLTLMSGLNFSDTVERPIFSIIDSCIGLLRMDRDDISDLLCRSPENEVLLTLMRFLSVLLIREKKDDKPIDNESEHTKSAWYIIACLISQDSLCVNFCLKLFKAILINFNTKKTDISSLNSLLLMPTQCFASGKDLLPFFMKQNTREKDDIFMDYEKILIETIMRLPCQLKRICDLHSSIPKIEFGSEWFSYLSEYMVISAQSQGVGRKSVRKLLLNLAGSRDGYRRLRDLHIFETNLKKIILLSNNGASCCKNIVSLDFNYDCQITILHCVNMCMDCAMNRADNWQDYCHKNASTVPFLLLIANNLHEEIAGNILRLVCYAICGYDFKSDKTFSLTNVTMVNALNEPKGALLESSKSLVPCHLLIKYLIYFPETVVLRKYYTLCGFLTYFLLETNSLLLRQQTQSFLWTIFTFSSLDQKKLFLQQFWSMFEFMLTFGQKAAQFVELLSQCSIAASPIYIKESGYLFLTVQLLKKLNEIIFSHPNSHVYQILSTVVELDGYFLESEPCLICNNPEILNSNLKLLSIKSDSKYTSLSSIFKLLNTYSITSINLKIADLKRQKMVKTICIYYSNKVFHSAVDLKNHKDLWYKAKEVTLHAGQHEIKVHFVLPIHSCNLIIEYSDFYESPQSALESLQCPRCSAPVPAHPGICGNCSENVYQCHKCRAINYDEKDPFLCNACGYSKYGKFDYSLSAKVFPSVEPISNEEERKKMIFNMTNLLEKADQVYKQLILHRHALDLLLTNGNHDSSSTSSKSKVEGVIIGINRNIYSITHRYCNDSKSTFNELSKIIQGILATRHELVRYDLQRMKTSEQSNSDISFHSEMNDFNDRSVIIDRTEFLNLFPNFGKCYGCIARASKHCVFLLKNFAAISSHKICLIDLGLLTELCNTNLRIGTSSMQNEVRDLILTLNHDNTNANAQLMEWLNHKLTFLIKQHHSHPNFGLAVHHEVQLMVSTMEYNDIGWEDRLRCLLIIFFNSTRHSTPVIFEYITLPFLKVILQLMDFDPMLSSKFKSIDFSDICTKNTHVFCNVSIVLSNWIARCHLNTFNLWKNGQCDSNEITLMKNTWLKQMLFHPSSQVVRCTASSLFLFLMKDSQRQKLYIDLLISYLVEVPNFGEVANEYLDLLKITIVDERWRVYLSCEGILLLLGQVISAEVSKLSSLEESTINVDVSLGYTLKVLASILFQLMSPQRIANATDVYNWENKIEFSIIPTLATSKLIQHNQSNFTADCMKDNKLKLLPQVLDVFLSLKSKRPKVSEQQNLYANIQASSSIITSVDASTTVPSQKYLNKRLVIQRTKRVDDAQEIIMELLDVMSSGTLLEKQQFMVICIDTLSNFPPTDVQTPIVIFEELCSVILPEEPEAIDFEISLEKDSQQEEFLQGRMQNNPYNASDPTIGPLMRDVKNKICRDTELLALLEEDTGMELLVFNKIISLDLNVKDVYQKLWLLSQPAPGNIMRVVYRMRGLLGEATEDMVDSFAKGEEEINNEEKFQIASIMSDCGGLEAVLFRLDSLQNPLHSINLLLISLKLLSYCVKLQVNRKYLLKSSLHTIDTLLSLFICSLSIEEDSNGTIGNKTLEIILEILLAVLHEASAISFLRIDSEKLIEEKVRGDSEQLGKLLSCINNAHNTDILKRVMKLIPFLTYGDLKSMKNILDHFSKYLSFGNFDNNPSSEHSLYLDCFCNITKEISYDESGITLRDMILDSGLVIDAINYIKLHTPSFVFIKGSVDWDVFLNKPSLEYILRFLTGVSINHTNTQKLLGDIIPQLHYTEKATTIKGIGSLAENLLDSLNTNEVIFGEVVRTRKVTKIKRLQEAQAFQARSLKELGITISDGKVEMKFQDEVQYLEDETGLTCCICMEGYDSHPRKILGIYTFAKCCIMDEFENKPRKTQGYSCVSGFSIVHLDCHNTAIRTSRQTRGKEEWEAASIHNSNIQCNSIIPVWGPEVQDNGYYSCLAKYHSSLQDATGCREPNFWSSIHDIKILLMRYGTGKSFSDECGGGSKLSNMRFLCYLISYSFYVLQSSGSFHKEAHNLNEFFSRPSSKWVSSVYELDSPIYFMVASIFLVSGVEWRKKRSYFLERLIITGHSRFHSNTVISSYTSLDQLEYNIYKPYLVVYALVDRIHQILKYFDTLDQEEMLSCIIQNYKTSDRELLLKFEKLMDYYEEELFPAESFTEYCDVIGILKVNENPDEFLSKCLAAPTEDQES